MTIPYVTTEEITKVITETLIQTQSPSPPVTYTKVQVITDQLPPIKIYKTQPAVTLPGETKEYTIYPPVGTKTRTYPSLSPESTTTYTSKSTSVGTNYTHPTPSSSSSTSVSEAPTTRLPGTGTVFPPKPTYSPSIFVPGSAAPATKAPAGVAVIVGMVVFLVLAG